ncbi:MAG TPA: hypothetical protein VHB21_25000 [Minicystis sp.]|nr:hypothetical protein [Minicystis sp.]
MFRVQILFRGAEPSDSVEAYVRARVAQMVRGRPGLLRCQVLVEAAVASAEAPPVFRARVVVASMRGEIVSGDIAEAPPQDEACDAIEDAFASVERTLEDGDSRDGPPEQRPTTRMRAVE